jgi:rhodanese-related sulfurtransferase
MAMAATLTALAVAALLILTWYRRRSDRHQLERHSITPEGLRQLLDAHAEILIYDVRQPLDLLADSEIIPGARRIPPKNILANPAIIPRDKDAVVYCTCPSDKTARAVLHRALAIQCFRVKFLKGGLAGWKAKGYPVEHYTASFQLDTA